MKILVINGPNMQLLGKREPDIYGHKTLEDINLALEKTAVKLKVKADFFQSNSEGAIVDRIAAAKDEGIDGIIINPAAYTHTSVAIHDALKAVGIPAVEVHISNIASREDFRKNSITVAACVAQIAGFGTDGYELALRGLAAMIKK